MDIKGEFINQTLSMSNGHLYTNAPRSKKKRIERKGKRFRAKSG